MGRFNFGGSGSDAEYEARRSKGIQDDPADEGVLIEATEGVLSGLIGIGEGIAELGAIGIDLVADTDYASDVTEGADALRRGFGKVPGLRAVFGEEGLDPTGIVGTGAEVITQFALPGLGAASAVSKGSKIARALGASKSGNVVSRRLAKGTDLGRKQELARLGRTTALTKSERLALGAQQVTAAGLADAMVATDGTTTIADFFEGGPTQTDQEIGLSGREEATRRLFNKFKIGAEGAGATVVAPVVVGAAAKGLGKTAQVVGADKAASYGAQKILEGSAKAKDVLDDLEYQRLIKGKDFAAEAEGIVGTGVGKLQNAVTDTLKVLRYRGALPSDIGEARSLITANVQAELKTATARLGRIEKGLDKAIKDPGVNTGDLAKQDYFNRIEEFLTSPSPQRKKEALESLPKSVRDDVVGMRTQIDDLSNDIMNSDFIKNLEGKIPKDVDLGGAKDVADVIRQSINKNLNSYMRRKYRIFEDAKYKPDQDTIDAGIAGFKANKRHTESELKLIRDSGEKSADELGLDSKGRIVGEVTDDQAKLAVDKFLDRHNVANKGKGPKLTGRVAEERLKTGMFIKRDRLKEFQKRLLGEIKDPEENFISTIADLAEFKATDEFFGKIRNEAATNKTLGEIFKRTDDMTPAQKTELKRKGYVILGDQGQQSSKAKTAEDFAEQQGQSGWGSLQGYAVPEAVYNQLTKSVEGGALDFLRPTYGMMLKLKGMSQYAKTVLSPITQIRNFTTAALFATAQGNVGRGANLGESVSLVMKDIFTKPSDEIAAELGELQRLGIIGTQAELREIQDLIRIGAAKRGPSETIVEGAEIDARLQSGLMKKLRNNYVAKKTGAVNQKLQDLYKGSDDVWKIYNFKFEQSKLQNALRGSSLDEQYRVLTGRAVPEGTQLNKQVIDNLIREESARIVRNNVPNYNLAPDAIKVLRKMPIGNFITFPYEIMRTGTNTITRGIKELASDNAEIQKIGMRRLTGALTTYGGAPIALSEFAYTVSGVSEEEMEAFRRSAAPEWERNSRLIPVGRNEDGNIEYINYSFSNPYDYLTRFAVGAMNAFDTSRRTGEPLTTGLRKAVVEAAAELATPFTDPSMIAEALIDVLPDEVSGGLGRSGKRLSGARVYNPEEDGVTQFLKGSAHVMNALIPSAIPMDIRGGVPEPSRFLRGVASGIGGEEGFLGISPKDRYGRERTLREEVTRAVSGVTVQEVEPERSLEYKGFEFREARQDAAGIFNSIARRENVNSEDLMNAYVKADKARYRVFNEFSQVVRDMEALGMSTRDIKRTLKDAGVGGVDSLISGRYEPFEVSKTIRKEMRSNGTLDLLPREEMRAYYETQLNKGFGDFDNVDMDAPETGGGGRFKFGSVAPSVVAPAAPAPTTAVAAAPAQAPQVSPPAATASAGQVSPILLGNSLATQQLAAQLGRTPT